MSFQFRSQATDGPARTGVLTTPHGEVHTPAFMPVGTRGTVRALDARDLLELGAQIVLANTYHLMLRPGAEVVADLGGLHGFMGWHGPILTDSGGYQVFSLGPHVDDEGVSFRSVYDGSTVRLTPERAVRLQEQLGADIAMVLDQLVGLPAPRTLVEEATERTIRWAERSLAARRRDDQALFAIVQGGAELDLRVDCARRLTKLDFPGYAIGGLAVGESAEQRNAALSATVAELPVDRVRYVMGLGDPEGVLAAVARGADLFDCVWPTRLARHGRVLTAEGDYSVRLAALRSDDRPLEEGCDCLTCQQVSRGYVRHLIVTNELSGFRLMSIHNLRYTMRVMTQVREAIRTGQFEAFRRRFQERRVTGAPD